MKRGLAAWTAVAALALAACGHVPVSTMWALRNFDGLKADPAFLRAAVRTPDWTQPRPGGVKVTLAWARDSQPETQRKVEVTLQEIPVGGDGDTLAKEQRPGTRLYAYRVAPADVPTFRAALEEADRAKAEGGGKTHGSLSVHVDACRTGDVPDGPLRLSTFLKTSEQSGWLTLLDDVDVRGQVPAGESLEADVPPCEKLTNRIAPAAAK